MNRFAFQGSMSAAGGLTGMTGHSGGLPEFSTVFQPIIEMGQAVRVIAYEALVRGLSGEGAAHLFDGLPQNRRHELDAASRAQAIRIAKAAATPHRISLNVLSGSICDPRHGLLATLEAASALGLPPRQIIFEITEWEPILDLAAARSCLRQCRDAGAGIAIDDAGTGFNSLHVMLGLEPDFIKLDKHVTDAIVAEDRYRRFFTHFLRGCQAIGIEVIAEGIETAKSIPTLVSIGIRLMQGYYFGRPESHFAAVAEGQA